MLRYKASLALGKRIWRWTSVELSLMLTEEPTGQTMLLRR